MSGTIATLTFTGHGPHELRVTDDGGVLLAERPVSEMAAGPGAWDRGLHALGFVRVGNWKLVGSGAVCRVSQLSRA